MLPPVITPGMSSDPNWFHHIEDAEYSAKNPGKFTKKCADLMYPDCSCNAQWLRVYYGIADEDKRKDAFSFIAKWHEDKCPKPKSKKSHEGNGAYNGPFAFTLTKSPKDPQTTHDMIKAVQKVMSQKSCPVIKYAWNLEYGDKNNLEHPHIHGIYLTKTGGRIEAKHFMRAWPLWDENDKHDAGFRGGYHRRVRHEECYQDYIAKDGGLGESYLPDNK